MPLPSAASVPDDVLAVVALARRSRRAAPLTAFSVMARTVGSGSGAVVA